jgi:hypothetical protein
MNVEIGTEAALFPENEYINGIFFAVCCTLSMLGLAGSTRSNSKWRVSSVGSLARASLGDRDLDLVKKGQIALLYYSNFLYTVLSGEKSRPCRGRKKH